MPVYITLCSEQLCACMCFGAPIECFGQSFACFDPDQTIIKEGQP